MSRGWRLVLPALLAGLLAGAWLGSRLERSAQRRMRREGPRPERVLKMLRRELALRPDQVQAVRGILEAKRPAFAAVRREEALLMDGLRAQIDAEITPLLDEPQRAKMEALRSRWRKRPPVAGPSDAR